MLGTRIAFSPAHPRDIFLTAFDAANLLRTTNAGASWARPLASWDNYNGGYDASVGGDDGNTVYAVLGQAGMFNGIGVSRDAGGSWSVHVGGTLPARYAVGGGQGSSPLPPATARARTPFCLTSTCTGPSTREPRGVRCHCVARLCGRRFTPFQVNLCRYEGRRRDNQGGTAPTLSDGSPGGLRRLVVAGDGAVYGVGTSSVTTTAGLWTNGSGTWSRLADDWWARDVAIDPRNRKRIAYVTNDDPYHTTSYATGAWISCNGGRSFSRYNRGLPMLRALSVAFDPSLPGRLIVGTAGRGFWQTQLRRCAGGVQPDPAGPGGPIALPAGHG